MIKRHSGLAARNMDSVEESINPLETAANITDVMLVFAVALMVALVARWGVDISNVMQIDESNLESVTADVTPSDIADSGAGNSYEEVGKVYKDVATGELYVLED